MKFVVEVNVVCVVNEKCCDFVLLLVQIVYLLSLSTLFLVFLELDKVFM